MMENKTVTKTVNSTDKKTETKAAAKTETAAREPITAVFKEDSRTDVKKTEAKKPEVKKAEPKTTAVKAETKTAVKEPAKRGRKPGVKKTTTAAKTAKTAKTAAAKTTAADKKLNMYIQFGGREYNSDDVVAKVKAAIAEETGKKTYKSLDIYVKPEDNIAYYVVNGKPGSVQL